MADKELVGFHKGALNTLLKERQELARMLKVVEQLIEAHAKELEKLGVDVRGKQQPAKKGKDLNEELEDILQGS